MTELRKRMIYSLQLRGLSERTQEAYVRAARQLDDHYHKSPDLITEEELRQYFLHIKNVKKYSRASSTIAICGIKFFYEKTLKREFTTLKLVREEIACDPQRRGSAEDTGAGEAATVSSVSWDYLLVRVEGAGRHTHSSA
jgi:integrase-like protein